MGASLVPAVGGRAAEEVGAGAVWAWAEAHRASAAQSARASEVRAAGKERAEGTGFAG